MLSSLGGWLESDAHWNLPLAEKGYNSSLLQWRHRAAQGRDNYVRVVRKGFLFPYGHRASLVTISEREFSHIDDNGSKDVGAYIRQRVFIIVTQPVKDYFTDDDQDPYVPHENRKFPFTTLELITKVTPDLYKEEPYIPAYAGGLEEKAFQPELSHNVPFLFHFRGTDWAGATIDFRSQVVWVDFTEAFGVSDNNPGHVDEIITQWRNDAPYGRAAQPAGQRGAADGSRRARRHPGRGRELHRRSRATRLVGDVLRVGDGRPAPLLSHPAHHHPEDARSRIRLGQRHLAADPRV